METNIVEQNKLIAVFMGGLYTLSFELKKGEMWVPIHGICRYDTIESGRGQTLQYHRSWDWIMPVVEKIENFNHSATLFIIEDERCHIDTQNGFEIDSVGHTKIEAVYNACIEFIKWYNNQIA